MDNNNNHKELWKDIYKVLDREVSSNFRPEELTNEVMELIIKKHGYEKVETLDGYWSD